MVQGLYLYCLLGQIPRTTFMIPESTCFLLRWDVGYGDLEVGLNETFRWQVLFLSGDTILVLYENAFRALSSEFGREKTQRTR